VEAENERGSTAKRKATSIPLLDLATAGFVLAWLAVAGYALAYLISH
jgi:hypothetical protein